MFTDRFRYLLPTILAVLACCTALPVRGQSEVNTATFFGFVPKETLAPSVMTNPNMSLVKRYELRTETRDFEPNRQEYLLRVTPSTRGLLRARKSLYRHLEGAPDFDAEDDRCGELANRYEDWVDLYRIDRERSLLDTLTLIMEDRTRVLSRMTAALDFDWSELIDLRQAGTTHQLRRSELTDHSNRLRESYGLQEEDLVLDFGDLIGPEEIARRLAPATLIAADPELAYDLATIDRELALERAAGRRYFDFAQIKYQGPHDDLFRERFSVGVGLQLDTDAGQKLKIRELALEREQLRREQLREAATGQSDVELRRRVLLGLLTRYRMAARLYDQEATDLAVISRQLAQRAGVNPLPLLDIRKRKVRNQLALLDLERDIYEGYVDLMKRRGDLCAAVGGELLR
jgi:hypothetical protein